MTIRRHFLLTTLSVLGTTSIVIGLCIDGLAGVKALVLGCTCMLTATIISWSQR